jgi:hypothetical protein
MRRAVMDLNCFESYGQDPRLIRLADHIHRFPAKISPKLALHFLKITLEQNKGNISTPPRFYDPLCGSGTLVLVAGLCGFDVSAGDVLDPAVTIAKAKVHRLDPHDLRDFVAAAESISVQGGGVLPTWKGWRVWYRPKVASSLHEMSCQIADFKRKPFFCHLVTGFFQTVWDVSAADKRVGVPTRSRFSPEPLNLTVAKVFSIFRSRVDRIVKAQQALRELGFPTRKPDVRQANALSGKDWPNKKFDLILTSPPYGCGTDYARAFRLQMRFSQYFFPSHSAPSQMIGRTNRLRLDDHTFQDSDLYPRMLRQLSKIDEPRVQMFRQYLMDLRILLRNSAKHLTSKGQLCLVIGNPQIAKTEVPLNKMIRKLAFDEGLTLNARQRSDRIRTRMQNFKLRSATNHINREFLLTFKRR